MRLLLVAFFAGILSLGSGMAVSAAEPSAQRSEQERCRIAAAYLKEHNGHALLVFKGDKLVFEEYFNDHTADKGHRLASGTKSFCGVMAAAAAEDGLLKLDELVADTITEWKDDARKSKITIRHLLSLTSGLDPGPTGNVPSYAEAIKAKALHDSGTKFQYGPVAFQVFGEVMRRKLAAKKESPLDYLKRRIFEPIGLKAASWREDKDGNPHLPSGAFLTAREWAKFGLFLKNKGKWDGKQIVTAEGLAECFVGSKARSVYGLTFWLANDPASAKAESAVPRDLVFAAGAGLQRLYVLPTQDMVVVHFMETTPKAYEINEFFARLLQGKATQRKPDKAPSGAVDHWPQFRGERAAGVITGKNLADTWSATENVAWKTEVPGHGWSSPVVWGEKIFLTSFVSDGKVVAPKTGYYAPKEVKTPEGEHRWTVFCLDARSGKILWERVAHKGRPEHSIHVKASYAAETPVTDGERVYAYFGNVGLFCYDLDGKELWSKKWGSYKTRLGWGTGASPVLHKDRIYVINDNEEKSFLIALDKKTGKEVWRVERDEKTSWATPFVWENDKRIEIVTSATGKVRSYDLDGKLLWSLGGMSSICVPMPVAAHGLLFVSSGYEFSRPRPVLAIRPGAAGDISLKKGETSNTFIAWYQEPAGAYHPTPLVYGDYLYVLYSRGFLACYDARTGKEVYGQQRLGGSFTASPWAHDGKIFCLSEEGDTHVIQAGAEFKVFGKNSLDEMCMATPAVAGNGLIVRTLTKVYRIDKKGN